MSLKLFRAFYCLHILLLVSDLINSEEAHNQPRISKISPQQIKNIGENVELECVTENAGHYSVMWSKLIGDKSRQVLTVSNTRVSKDTRYSINYEESRQTYTLQIKELLDSDKGTYMCEITVAATKRFTATVDLFVGNLNNPNVEETSNDKDCVETSIPQSSKTYNFQWKIHNLEDYVHLIPKESSNKRLKLETSNKAENSTMNASITFGTRSPSVRNMKSELILNLTSLGVNDTQMDVFIIKLKVILSDGDWDAEPIPDHVEFSSELLTATWSIAQLGERLLNNNNAPVEFHYQVKMVKLFDDHLIVNGRGC